MIATADHQEKKLSDEKYGLFPGDDVAVVAPETDEDAGPTAEEVSTL